MRCFVTGAAGFIGNSLTKRLVDEGHDVKSLIHKTEPKFHVKKAEYVNGDITDAESIKSLVRNTDVVFHCAAFVRDYGPRRKFYSVNYEGTKNLVSACESSKIKKFIFISHIRYESEKDGGYYTKTKAMAEQYLLHKYEENNFPAVIVRPGNVYGPNATIWVLRPLEAIQKNRIALIDDGKGIFLHTYIDNLLDALLSVMKDPKVVGETIDITDGDNTTTWGEYLNCLAKIAGKKSIKKNMSKNTALMLSRVMIFLYKVFKIEPIITPMAINVFTNNESISMEKAESLLGYKPKVDFKEGMRQVEIWLKNEGYVN